jgi:hypothetical protein
MQQIVISLSFGMKTACDRGVSSLAQGVYPTTERILTISTANFQQSNYINTCSWIRHVLISVHVWTSAPSSLVSITVYIFQVTGTLQKCRAFFTSVIYFTDFHGSSGITRTFAFQRVVYVFRKCRIFEFFSLFSTCAQSISSMIYRIV